LPYILYTDASDLALGAILAQQQDGKEVVIAYASRVLNTPEKNYSITEKECLGVVWGVEKFKHYLYGNKFTVITDHSALVWLLKLKEPKGRLCRWILKLQLYDFNIEHKKGKLHTNVDSLSRLPTELNVMEHKHLRKTDLLEVNKISINLGESEEMVSAQRADRKINGLINYITKGTLTEEEELNQQILRESDNYIAEKGLLFNVSSNNHRKLLRIVVPETLKKDILIACHDDPLAGHLGLSKTYARIQNQFYWIQRIGLPPV